MYVQIESLLFVTDELKCKTYSVCVFEIKCNITVTCIRQMEKNMKSSIDLSYHSMLSVSSRRFHLVFSLLICSLDNPKLDILLRLHLKFVFATIHIRVELCDGQ